MSRRLTITADDFGLSPAVNEAVERAHRTGVLHAASLMVAGPAAADAVARARRMPGLRVGLHLVAVDGPGVTRDFPAGQVGLALRYAVARRGLAGEIRAQFAAFAATGLALAHADAHKHMHLHPVVGALMIGIGREFGLRRVRVPAEPPGVMAALGARPGVGARALFAWTRVLRGQARRAGMEVPDHVFGLAWSGAFTAGRLRRLLDVLPGGDCEIYLHPTMAEPEGDLAALLDEEGKGRLFFF
jgi:hopanoid biosynthesis associated protein HpnK